MKNKTQKKNKMADDHETSNPLSFRNVVVCDSFVNEVISKNDADAHIYF